MSITGVSKESMNGVKFTLIYNAVSTFVEGSTSRKIKSKSIRQVATKNRCRYCLRVVDGSHEFYFFAPKSGISFARQLEYFIANSGNPRWQEDVKVLVIIALDSRVYMAEITRGEVVNEHVLVVAVARDRINEMSQTVHQIFWIAGGHSQTELGIDGLTEIEDGAITVKKDKAFTFSSLSILMTRHLLFHPSQVMCTLPILIISLLGSVGYIEYRNEIERAFLAAQEAAAKERNRVARAAKERTSKSDANHSGSVNLLSLLSVFQQSLDLSADGVAEVSWNRTGVKMSGKSAHFPHRAARLGRESDWHFRLSNEGWTVQQSSLAHTNNKRPTVGGTAMRHSLFSLANVSHSDMKITDTLYADEYEIIEFVLTMRVGIQTALVKLSEAMHDKPYRLDSALCRFSGRRTAVCNIAMTAKYGEQHD